MKRIDEVSDRVITRAGVGSTPYVEIGDVDVDTKRYTLKDKPSPSICISASKNDVLVSKVRPTRGAITKLRSDAYVSLGFAAVRPKINADFLFYSLCREEFLRYLGTLETGTTYPSCDDSDVANYQIAVPTDNAEQEKIAEVLGTLDQMIEKTEMLINKYEHVRSGMMQDLFKYTQGWNFKPLGQVAAVTKLAGYEFTEHIKYTPDGEVIALRALNIKNRKLDLNDIQRIYKKTSDFLVRSKIFSGDILITYIGAYIGDTLLIRESDKYHLAPNIAKITCFKGYDPEYIELALTTQNVRKQYSQLTAVTATPSLTMTQIRNIEVLIPPSLDEQKKIAKIFVQIDEMIDSERIHLGKLRGLKNGLMSDLLTPQK